MTVESVIDRAVLEHAVATFELAVDAVYLNTLSVSRLIHCSPEDIPRLAIAAGCRSFERLIEAYRTRREMMDSGELDRDETELSRRRGEILRACQQLVATLADGMQTAQAIVKTLGLNLERPQ